MKEQVVICGHTYVHLLLFYCYSLVIFSTVRVILNGALLLSANQHERHQLAPLIALYDMLIFFKYPVSAQCPSSVLVSARVTENLISTWHVCAMLYFS